MEGKKVADFRNIGENNFDVSYIPVGNYLVVSSINDGAKSNFKLIIE